MEFDDLGARCTLPTCRLQDYLPYSCPRCHETYCHTHRHPSSHFCPSIQSTSIQETVKVVVECKDCGKVLGTSRGDAESAQLLRKHFVEEGDCMRQRRKKKSGNGCSGCGKKLGFGGGMKCQSCHKLFCVECRLEEDHECKGGKKGSNDEKASGWMWNRAMRVWGVSRSKEHETRVNAGAAGRVWGIWVRVGGTVRKEWVALEPKWAVGKAVDVIGEKLKLNVRDENARRWELVIRGNVQDRLDKLGNVVKKSEVVDIVRERKTRNNSGVGPACGMEVDRRKVNTSLADVKC